MPLTLTFTGHDGTCELSEGRRPVITVHGNAEDPEAAKALARKVAAVGEMEGALRAMKAAFCDPITRRTLGGHNGRQMRAVIQATRALALSRGGEHG